ncbi:MAG: hypothetical protein WBO25_03600, partial [Acidimicrobiia bacterium]
MSRVSCPTRSLATPVGLDAQHISPGTIYLPHSPTEGVHVMHYRRLGSTGYDVSEIGFGAW